MEPFDPAKLSAHDKAAMQLAIEQVAAEGEAARQEIDDRLRARPWLEVAEDVVWRCQDRNLKLRPWDCPPCRTRDIEDPSDMWGYRPNEIALLRRMLAAGVSRFHPDPMRALAEAERKQQSHEGVRGCRLRSR